MDRSSRMSRCECMIAAVHGVKLRLRETWKKGFRPCAPTGFADEVTSPNMKVARSNPSTTVTSVKVTLNRQPKNEADFPHCARLRIRNHVHCGPAPGIP